MITHAILLSPYGMHWSVYSRVSGVALVFSWRTLQRQQQQFPRLKEVPICFLCLLKTFFAQARVRFFVSFENVWPRLG